MNKQRVNLLFTAIVIICSSSHVLAQNAPAKPRRRPLTNDYGLTTRTTAAGQRLVLEGSGFSVFLPSIPQPVTKSLSQGATPVTVTAYTLRDGSIEYNLASIGDLPARMLTKEGVAYLFSSAPQNMQEAARRAGKAEMRLMEQREITLEGNSGVEYTFESAAEHVKARGYVIGSKFVTVSVVYPKNEVAAKTAEGFLQTISIVR